MRKSSGHRGFTIIELSLSIVFISILSISIVLIITNSISSYRRGLTLNQINNTGMDLVDDLRAAVQNSPARSVVKECAAVYSDPTKVKNCEDDNAKKFIVVKRTAEFDGIGNIPIPVYGAFCTGSYSYIWNSGYFWSDTIGSKINKAILKYNKPGSEEPTTTEKTDFKLLKIEDKERAVCISAVSGEKGNNNGNYNNQNFSPNNGTNEFNITSYSTIEEEPVELLTSNNLAIYDLDTSIPAESDNRNSLFYAVSFILGTVQGGINFNTTNCAPPQDANSNFDYCAINKFNFAAQAIGG